MSLPALRGPVSLLAESALNQILHHFPRNRITYAFAYGSAIFAQKGQNWGKMVDIVFVVDSPVEWHSENMVKNRDHYSALKYFGPRGISMIQERMASGVYYNPFVKVGDHLIKYGVISTASLERDLNTWNKIYIAGRLHKPVLDLVPPVSARLREALHYNRESALRAVLLQEGRFLSKYSLYHGITELSYLGDSRMSLAENPDKAKNIVMPLMKEFDRIYAPLIQGIFPKVEETPDGLLTQITSPNQRFLHLMALPNKIQLSLCRHLFRDPRLCDIEEIMAEISYFPNLGGHVRSAVRDVVWGSSILQTFQGLLSAGFSRSWKYTKEKLIKGREGRRSRKEYEAIEEASEEYKNFTRKNFQIKYPQQHTTQVDNNNNDNTSQTQTVNLQSNENKQQVQSLKTMSPAEESSSSESSISSSSSSSKVKVKVEQQEASKVKIKSVEEISVEQHHKQVEKAMSKEKI